jgi:hypothetical protein
VRSRGEVLLVTEDERSIPATVYDVSSLGMRVETSEELASGLPVRIEVHKIAASGEVRYCIRKDDKYQVGVSFCGSPSGSDTSGSEPRP